MATILGIYDGHDAGAALIHDKDIFAINEERMSREKYRRGFPELSIKKVLRSSGVKGKEIDKIAVAGIYRKKKRLLKLKKKLKRIIGDLSDKILTVDHHLAHASGAFFTSGSGETVVLTSDAAGDGISSRVYQGEEETLRPVAESSYMDSLGDFYASMTEMLGFEPMRHEGKTMALAGYHAGEKPYDFSDCLEVKGLSFKNHLEVTGSESMKMLSEKIGFPLNRKKECGDVLRNHKNEHELWDLSVEAAASAQAHLEKLVNELTENIKSHGELKENICYSGGVAQNVKGNKILKEKFENCWVFPHMGDGGLALGAALYVNSIFSDEKIKWDWKDDGESVYIGPKYSSKNILQTVQDHDRLLCERMEEKADAVAGLLEKGKLVGLFQGRMEYGPRALGNRSILADPSKEEMKDELNRKLGRETFQPFSPTILEGYQEVYLKNAEPNRFMTMSFDITERAENDLRGAVHVDKTCRPQILKREDNQVFYDIVKSFEERSGIGAVLNTSFNLHGEPIVCKPQEAIKTMNRIELDALLCEDLLVRRSSS